ncbi:MAG TPA: bifunctional diguanylate cyclase/phosphodiesterase [Jatrophihabitans sp.]|nr:bifunctional diguanylate cyclase/phosphodiesterase [Jatrophihabitans sp.]
MDSSVRPDRRAVVVGAAALLVACFAATLRMRAGGEFAMRAVDDLGQAFAAAVGAAGCAWRAARCSARWRLSWALLAGALASWAAGELVWSYYELLARRETPFPSFADLGYLMFPALALPGLLVRPSSALSGRGRCRVLLDGTMVAGSLFSLSWATSLGQVYHSGAQDTFSFAVGLAYPASDLVMLTVAVTVLAHARVRHGLALLILGLAAMAVADSGFSYLTAVGSYHTGSVVDIAWFAAFLLMGVSAVLSPATGEVEPQRIESPVFLALPYAVVLIGGAAAALAALRHETSPITLIVEAGALGALLLRQLLTVLDNRRLALDVIDQQVELRYRAFHDALTGLANRALFCDRLAHALALHARDRRTVSVLFCDLDDFKSVNDTLGHDAGDALLTGVAARLLGVVRAGDTVARLGGDEFAILLEDGGDVDVLSARLLASIAVPVPVSGREVPVRASIGTATVGPEVAAVGIQELLKRADVAMYAAKRQGKSTWVSYSPDLQVADVDDLDERLTLAEDIRCGRLRTAFQPIVRANGRPYAFEALARWNYRGREVAPSRFVPLAERAGLLAELDMLTIRNALARAVTPGSGCERLLVSVNLALQHLHDTDLTAQLLGLLERTGVPPNRIVVEVSESEALEDPRAEAALLALRGSGISLALDDFGTGYSNLARLGRLAPDVVKLDRSLVERLEQEGPSVRLVGGMIELAHDLGALVVAEGVETERELAMLRELGCDAMQGFLIGAPIVPEPVQPEPVLVEAARVPEPPAPARPLAVRARPVTV